MENGDINALDDLPMKISEDIDTSEVNMQTIEEIAHFILNIDSLERRNFDNLDFHKISVWNIKKALCEAYRAGKEDGKETRTI